MSEFTKGPWLVRTTGQHWNNPELLRIEINYGTDQECVCDTVYKMADANLIAAAPDLYGACTEIESPLRVAISMLRRGTPSQNEIADELQLKLGDLCTALAKANGQEKGE